MMRLSLIDRLDARDRSLYLRWVIASPAPRGATRLWAALTHLGGLTGSSLAVLIPLLLGDGALRAVAMQAAWALVLSNLVVQLIKRRVLRERPAARVRVQTHVVEPDRFSFPSGHSCAVMSVAFVFAAAYPVLAWPLLLVSGLVGFSRVRLGVHYPGDVLVGQAIAIAVGSGVWVLTL